MLEAYKCEPSRKPGGNGWPRLVAILIIYIISLRANNASYDDELDNDTYIYIYIHIYIYIIYI